MDAENRPDSRNERSDGDCDGHAGPARLLIVDDHELAREGLRSMLAGEADLQVVGEAASGQQALTLCAQLRPDIVLMDVRMPDMDGLAATRVLRKDYPDTQVIVVTMYDEPDYLYQALQAGAVGYLLKDSTKQQVLSVIRQVLGGAVQLSPRVMTHLLQRLAKGGKMGAPLPASDAHAPPENLTPRELSVLRLLSEGQTNREIARRLGVSVGTVKVHVGHVIAKLEVVDRTQAAVRAVELGLLTPEEATTGPRLA